MIDPSDQCTHVYVDERRCLWRRLDNEDTCSKHRKWLARAGSVRCPRSYGRGSCPWNVAPGDSVCTFHRPPAPALPEPPFTQPVPEQRTRTMWVTHEVNPEVVEGDAIVYYLGDPVSQLVKIGTTTKLRQRMKSIRKVRPRTLVLATEPGGYDVEAQRHGEWRRLNVPMESGEREWFRRDPLLMAWITETRHRHGIICPGYPIEFGVIAPVRRHLASPSR